ncbi:hypothetical protein [Singulisphaera sp. PoT]|uniref:hypothetical protein n=1 Tax=Singulisphaera sp. PoT TaxID=3411797 RepID=UPI003BF5850D
MINRVFATAGRDGASAPPPKRKGERVFRIIISLAVFPGGVYVEVVLKIMTTRRWLRSYADLGPAWHAVQAGPVVVLMNASAIGPGDERWGQQVQKLEEARRSR